VKDTLAYVRLALHPEDDVSLLRVLNVPARGIGKTTVDALRDVAQKESLSFWDAMESIMTNPASSRAVAPLRAFRELIQTAAGCSFDERAGGLFALCAGRDRLHECAEGPETCRKTWRD